MDLLLQIQADQLRAPVSRPVVQETTALGAGYVAGVAEGVWSADDLASRWQLDRRVEPADDARVEADERYAQWRRAVERSRGWA
jgi:glycerol kinase